MRDLLFALGAILAVEGLLLAIAPERLKTVLETMAEYGPDRLRIVGLVAAIIGTAILTLAT